MSASEKRYKNVQVRLWSDEKFLRLSRPAPSGQGLWIYLLTCRAHTAVPGLVLAGRYSLAEDLDWTLDDLDRCWKEIEAAGMAVADWHHRVVWLPHALEQPENLPKSSSQAAGWRRVMHEAPECELSRHVHHEILRTLRAKRPNFLSSYKRGIRLDMADSQECQLGFQDVDDTSEITATDRSTERSTDRSADRSTSGSVSGSRSEIVSTVPSSTACALDTHTTRASARVDGQGALVLAHPAKDAPPNPLGKPASKKNRELVERFRIEAEQVLSAISAARKRINPQTHGITPSYVTLGLIAERLADGYTLEDCMHVVKVCELDAEASEESYKYFNHESPFRTRNFAVKLAADPGVGAGAHLASLTSPVSRAKVSW